MAKNRNDSIFDLKLMDVYEKYGLAKFIDVCSELLDMRDTTGTKKPQVNGEVCEIVLHVMTEHYLATKGKKGQVFHSLVLGNPNNPNSSFRTELDVTLVTPYFCITGECKSYAGDVRATGEGKLRHNGYPETDVAKQSKVHVNALIPYLKMYTKAKVGVASPPVGMFCFLYSNGTITDNRVDSAKDELPILTIKSLFSYYDRLFSQYRKEVYDVEKAGKAFQAMADSRVLHIQHANYLGY